MSAIPVQFRTRFRSFSWLTLGVCAVITAVMPMDAHALPIFARQTGQNCVSCHAGGQFPELTPYGRMFKMTGYTVGARTIPFAVMGVANAARVGDTSKSDDPSADFQKNGKPVFSSASLFIGGKVTDNIGLFSQITYDNYAMQDDNGQFHGHSSADNVDLRYADRFVDANRDFIFGFSVNNNPSVTDPWNTAAAWMQYVPAASLSSHQFTDAATPYPGFDAGAPLAGFNAYAFWNKTIYADVGLYKSADRLFSILSAGTAAGDKPMLKGIGNPYWRVAYTREWGANNIMVGATGMVAHVYDVGSDTSDPGNLNLFRNVGIDAQYQYLLDPHTVTVQMAYMRETEVHSANTMAAAEIPYFQADGVTPVAAPHATDVTNIFRAKVSYIYQAKYGGSFAFFNKSGASNTLNQTSGFDSMGQITSMDPNETGIVSTRVGGSLNGSPATRGQTYEVFWTPLQYVRVGLQYTTYSKFNGASTNYDGFGRNAKDNNTLFGYVWFAF